MPLFLSDGELEALRHDGVAVAAKADSYIRELYAQFETVKAQADAASITAEQTCSQLEHNYLSLSSDYSNLESRFSELESKLQASLSELAQVQAEKHQLHIKAIEKDGEIERMSTEVSELHKSKRQLMAMLEQKDAEISEKNSTIKSYLDKIVNMTENVAEREARLSDAEAELVRSHASCERLLLEKELIETHNAWLNEELTAKSNNLMELHRKYAEHDAEISAKLRDVEKQYEESSKSIKWYKERVSELEMKLTSLQEDLCSTKDSAATNEERYVAEISTVSKLVELYKESSEEWSKKAGELEGVVKAMEMHLSQLQNEHKENVEKEVALRKEAEKEVAELKEKLVKCEAEIESHRKAREMRILPLSSFSKEGWVESFNTNHTGADNLILGPSIPSGVSGTALAATLIRDGWSLAKMYAKYQEAVDALRHEQLGRKQSQAVLERVLLEIEEKASVILDERAEHERMADAYDMMNEKLHQSLSEQANLEKNIQELKAGLRRRERDYNLTQKEIADLQKQVTVLLKECRDIQLRCGSAGNGHTETNLASVVMDINADTETVISEHLITFHDINGLVEQNVKLRSLVRSLSDQIENKENELKEQFEIELQMHNQQAASKVATVLERAEQQERMIDSLHSSVAMYKRLYEEEHKLRSSDPQATSILPDDGRREQVLLLENSQSSAKQAQEQYAQRVHCLEEDLSTLRSEIISLRAERDKYSLESSFALEKLERYVKDMDRQREEMNGILSRNVEFQRLIVDYQKQLRESSQSLLAAEELSRKLTMEVSVLKREKELLQNSERRACDEVRDLSTRVHRLQASLDTIHIAEQVRAEARGAERKKLEEHTKHIEREWAEAKKELQAERDNARVLSRERDNSLRDAMRQIEQMGIELASALQAATAAETKAATSEARCSDFERKLKTFNPKTYDKDGGIEDMPSSTSEFMRDLSMAKEEIERLKLESQANKDHMTQYKNIADVNEAALKQMESSFELYRSEAENRKNLLEEEVSSLRERVVHLENESSLRSEEASSVATEWKAAFESSQLEIAKLKDEISNKISQIALLEVQINSLQTNLQEERQKGLTIQENYRRQVILQAGTIEELTRTSGDLALLKEESSKLRKLADAYKSENDDLKARWDSEKSELEKCKSEAEKKYNEVNEQNKILHTRLEAMHIKSAERDRQMAGITSPAGSTESESDSGLQSVITYLRRSKEIADTEISLLKQEKLRLQSQFERALKEAEAAQASLSEQRANARNLVFSEEDFKTLQLQVSDMNLLRESNNQLREENMYNFEECQKLREVAQKERVEAENLRNLLKEKEMLVEALRKEINLEKEEKENCQKRISELLEKSKNIDVEEYIQMKSDYEEMKVSMQEKEREIERTRSLLSEKEEIVSKLEHELGGAKTELVEKENYVSQLEANLKSELEKLKKMNNQLKNAQRRADFLLKEKESLTKEKESLIMEKGLISKEKEEKGKEIEGLLKQLEENRQDNKATGNVDTLVNEKDKRIQTLERVIEREREEKRKERDRRMSTEKVITAKVTSVEQERKKFGDEQEKHKEALKRISEEFEKLKHARDTLPEGTSVIQLLSSNTLDDLASSYVSAVESFEKSAHSVLLELGAPQTSSSIPVTDSALTGSGGSVAPAPVVPSSSMASPARPQSRAVDDREKKSVAPKINSETRKIVRRLVRPRLAKSEEPQGDSEMTETEGPSNTAGKPGRSSDPEPQVSQSLPTDPVARKRIAASSASDLHDESLQQAPIGSDVTRGLKRTKPTEPPQNDAQGNSPPENVEPPAAASEDVQDVANEIPEVAAEDTTDSRKDDTESSLGQPEESKEPLQSEEGLVQYDDTTMIDDADKANEGATTVEEVQDSQLESPQQTGDIEEGEVSESLSGGDETTTNNEVDEVQTETDASPLRTDEEQTGATMEDVNEITPDDLNADKMEEGELTEDAVNEDVNDGNDQLTGEAEQSNETAIVTEASNIDTNVSRENSSLSSTPPAGTTINLNARAKEKSALRMAKAASTTLTTTTSTSTLPAVTRGRGRPVVRGRGRLGRGGRRPPSGDQS
ncbi:hypothetical protein V2J09_008054 [Rumex salicifolius]